MLLAEGEREEDAKRPIRGEGKAVVVAGACSGVVLRGQQGLRTSTFEVKGVVRGAWVAPGERALVSLRDRLEVAAPVESCASRR